MRNGDKYGLPSHASLRMADELGAKRANSGAGIVTEEAISHGLQVATTMDNGKVGP